MTDEATKQTAHQILKDGERTPHPYRVTIGDSGPAVYNVSGLRAGGGYSFNRLGENDSDRTGILRLTAAEARSLEQAGFTVERIAESEVPTVDPFGDPDDGSDTGDADDSGDDAEDEDEITEADWPLAITPLAYIETKPDGPKAELAHAMIAAGFGNASTK